MASQQSIMSTAATNLVSTVSTESKLVQQDQHMEQSDTETGKTSSFIKEKVCLQLFLVLKLDCRGQN